LNKGFDPKGIDGYSGQHREALIAYQKAAGLAADGVVSRMYGTR